MARDLLCLALGPHVVARRGRRDEQVEPARFAPGDRSNLGDEVLASERLIRDDEVAPHRCPPTTKRTRGVAISPEPGATEASPGRQCSRIRRALPRSDDEST